MSMLGFLSAIVELVDLREGQLLFRSGREYPIGKQVQVRIAMPPGSGRLTMISVVIVSSRPLEAGGVLYVSKLTSESKAVITGELQDAALRRAERHNLGIRVMSRQLAGFKGMTLDLSRTGLQLEMDGPVDRGQILELMLEFDRFDLPRLTVCAEVMWCRPDPVKEGQFRAGCQFVLDDERTRQAVDRVADFFEHRSQADLETLLDQAKLLRTESARVPPPKPERRKARRTSFILPVQALITGYRWDYARRRARVQLRGQDGHEHSLEFPECQTLRDYCCLGGVVAQSMRTSSDSPLLQELSERLGPGAWKHYQFLDDREALLLEIVSAACESGAY